MLPKIMPVSDLRRNTSDVLSTLREGEVVYITQHGRPTAVLLDYERYEMMLTQLEDLSDLAALGAAVEEPERDYEEYLAERNHGKS